MRDVFDAYQYVDYLRRRWRFIALSCTAAISLAAVFTFLQPRQYTALTSLMIDPPAGIDSRSAMTISPVYMDSLRTYELFAASDSLFQKAMDHFSIRNQNPGMSIEDWKRKILKVEMPRNTKILEIRVMLPEPKTAHAFALYLAEAVVELNRGLMQAGDQDLASATENQLKQALRLRDQAEQDLQKLMQRGPTGGLDSEVETLKDRLTRIDRELTSAEQSIAEATERLRQSPGDSQTQAGKEWERYLAVDKVKVTHLKAQRQAVTEEIARKSLLSADRSVQFDQAQSRLRSADTALRSLENKFQETRSMAGSRTEHLRMLDPGVVPERHSSPRLSLNLVASFLAGIVLSILYLSFEFGYVRWRMIAELRQPKMTSRHADD